MLLISQEVKMALYSLITKTYGLVKKSSLHFNLFISHPPCMVEIIFLVLFIVVIILLHQVDDVNALQSPLFILSSLNTL